MIRLYSIWIFIYIYIYLIIFIYLNIFDGLMFVVIYENLRCQRLFVFFKSFCRVCSCDCEHSVGIGLKCSSTQACVDDRQMSLKLFITRMSDSGSVADLQTCSPKHPGF